MRLAAAMLAVSLTSPLVVGAWSEEYLQGVTAYTQRMGPGYFSIQCSVDTRMMPPSVLFSLDGTQTISAFKVQVDGAVYSVENNLITDDASFDGFYAALRTARSLAVEYNGKSYEIALGAIESVLPPVDSTGYACESLLVSETAYQKSNYEF